MPQTVSFLHPTGRKTKGSPFKDFTGSAAFQGLRSQLAGPTQGGAPMAPGQPPPGGVGQTPPGAPGSPDPRMLMQLLARMQGGGPR